MTFKDNINWLEHQRSKQHQHHFGLSDKIRRADLEEVKATLEALKKRKAMDENSVHKEYNLREAVEALEAENRQRQELKRQTRKEARRNKAKLQEESNEIIDVEMAQIMGFGGFGSGVK